MAKTSNFKLENKIPWFKLENPPSSAKSKKVKAQRVRTRRMEATETKIKRNTYLLKLRTNLSAKILIQFSMIGNTKIIQIKKEEFYAFTTTLCESEQNTKQCSICRTDIPQTGHGKPTFLEQKYRICRTCTTAVDKTRKEYGVPR